MMAKRRRQGGEVGEERKGGRRGVETKEKEGMKKEKWDKDKKMKMGRRISRRKKDD
jgi:hypothetical protein